MALQKLPTDIICEIINSMKKTPTPKMEVDKFLESLKYTPEYKEFVRNFIISQDYKNIPERTKYMYAWFSMKQYNATRSSKYLGEERYTMKPDIVIKYKNDRGNEIWVTEISASNIYPSKWEDATYKGLILRL